jgi:hypothetical protein
VVGRGPLDLAVADAVEGQRRSVLGLNQRQALTGTGALSATDARRLWDRLADPKLRAQELLEQAAMDADSA